MNERAKTLAADGIFLIEEATLEIMNQLLEDAKCCQIDTISHQAGIDLEQLVSLGVHPMTDYRHPITNAVLGRLHEQGRVEICDHFECHGWQISATERDARKRPPELTQDMHWETTIDVEKYPQTGNVLLKDLDWTVAVYQHGPSIQESLEAPDLHYVTKLDELLTVGYSFRFAVENGAVVAHGQLHPAERYPGGDHHVNTDRTIAQAKLTVTFQSKKTEERVKRYIQAQPTQ